MDGYRHASPSDSGRQQGIASVFAWTDLFQVFKPYDGKNKEKNAMIIELTELTDNKDFAIKTNDEKIAVIFDNIMQYILLLGISLEKFAETVTVNINEVHDFIVELEVPEK